MKKQLVVIFLVFFIISSTSYAGEDIITTKDDAIGYVYSLTGIGAWHTISPPMIGIGKGYYKQPGHPQGDFLRFGTISGETWDSLGLKDDKVYKDGENFIIERNVCVLPNWVVNGWATPDDDTYKEYTKGAKIIRIRETVTPSAEHSFETLEVITDKPPLMEIFHWENQPVAASGRLELREWIKGSMDIQEDASDEEFGEYCYNRADSRGRTGIFGVRTSTEWLLAAIEFDPENKKYQDKLVEIYEAWWDWEDTEYDYDIDRIGWSPVEIEWEKERYALQHKIEKMVIDYKARDKRDKI